MEDFEAIQEPTTADWHRVEQVREILTEIQTAPGNTEALVAEAVARLVAHEEHWSEDETAMAIALVLGNATPENLTIIPF